MKKIIAVLLLLISFGMSSYAQQTRTKEEKLMVFKQEGKNSLIQKLGLKSEVADKIVDIETEFYNALVAIDAQKNPDLKQREIKLNAAHITRREKLMAAPLTPREMEDVIDLMESIKTKQKL